MTDITKIMIAEGANGINRIGAARLDTDTGGKIYMLDGHVVPIRFQLESMSL